MSQLQELKTSTLVVGASSGIGRATAELLVSRGQSVIGVSRKPPIEGGKWYWYPLDITNETSRLNLSQHITALGMTLDKIVFSQAKHGDKSFTQWDTKNFLDYMEVNCFGVGKLFEKLKPCICATGCNIVLLGSALQSGSMNQPAYAMSKAALHTWMRSFTMLQGNQYREGDDININMLWPGRVNTPANPGRELPHNDPNRFREPEEIARYIEDMLNWKNGPRGIVLDLGR